MFYNHVCSRWWKKNFNQVNFKRNESLSKFFNDDFSKKIFVYADPDDILGINQSDYIQLILDKLIEKLLEMKIKLTIPLSSNPLIKLKGILENVIASNYQVIFILQDFEFTLELPITIYRNLESILSINKKLISYIFLTSTNILDQEMLLKFHNFQYAINRNVFYYPLLENEISTYLINKFSEELHFEINDELHNTLLDLCGGHPQLLKYSVYILCESEKKISSNSNLARDYLLNYHQLISICTDIWSHLNTNEKASLKQIAQNGKIKSNSKNDYLINTKIIKKQNDKYVFFGKIFESFVQKKLPKSKLIYNIDTDNINYGFISCGEMLTRQEFSVVKYFIINENKIVSRDEIGNEIWGENSDEKYSDWYIDKIISTIRKKLSKIGYNSKNLSTIKGRGFCFINK